MNPEKARVAPVRQWTSDSLSSEVRAVIDMWARTEGIEHVAVMPDVHLGEVMCIGCAVASGDVVFPEAVGADIGCGMTAIRFGPEPYSIRTEDVATRIMDGLYRTVPAGYHPRRSPPAMGPMLSQTDLSDEALARHFRNDGVLQFGTVGSGNHFVELQADEDGFVWLMVHTGSRGLGQTVFKHHLGKCAKTETGLRYLAAGSDDGRAYFHDVGWLVSYASASRMSIIAAVGRILRDVCSIEPDASMLIDCPHNFVRRETHLGRPLWVHRKGAISAAEGESGVVPGSMGTASFHVVGRGCAESLCSSAHGAGRAMSRSDARRRISPRDLRRGMGDIWFDHRKIAALVDEAPAAYKDVDKVMRAQRELVRVVRRLTPVLSYKGAR